jgi:protoheme IX farnesyltransferase
MSRSVDRGYSRESTGPVVSGVVTSRSLAIPSAAHRSIKESIGRLVGEQWWRLRPESTKGGWQVATLDRRSTESGQQTSEPVEGSSPLGQGFAPSRGWWPMVRAYIAITKPRIIELLLVTTVPTMILASGGWPDLATMIAVIVGGSLAAAGASTFNSVYDRDIDATMQRTAHRPVASGVISARAGIVFALVLSTASIAVLWAFTTPLAAGLAIIAILGYAVGYTVILKRRTAQNIVWGGAAGCMPVLIGWAAVTDSLSWAPLALFLVVFFWTPPHYWPLSLRYRDDYVAAGVPMLPVLAQPQTVMRHILAYSLLMIAASMSLIWLAPMGLVYTITAVVTGLVFLAEVARLWLRVARGDGDPAPMRLFHGSITYLAVLFLSVAIDPFVGSPVVG